jgi:4-amino-4-deoxy-L-arabinose transferase-like glycosyltransferase
MNPFAIAHKTVSAIYSFLEARTPLKNTILLYIFTAAIVMALLSIILALVVSAIGFVTYNWRTREYR